MIALPRRVATFGWAVVAAVATFPSIDLRPQPGNDFSWQAGLVMARANGLRFGHEIVFTYGPLGFLAHPVLWGAAALPAVVGTLLGLFGLVLLGTFWLRPTIGAPGAAIVSGMVVHLGWTYEPSILTPVLYALVAAALVALLRPAPVGTGWCAAVGAAVSFLVLVKTDAVGLGALAVVGFCVAGRNLRSIRLRRIRSLTVAAVSFIATLLIGWISSGQAASDLPGWIRDSSNVAAGFNEAMVFRLPPFSPSVAIVWTLWFSVLVAAVLVMAPRNARAVPQRSMGLFAVVYSIVVVWLGAKSGFVRFDGHAYRYVLLLLVLSMALVGHVGRALASHDQLPWSSTVREQSDRIQCARRVGAVIVVAGILSALVGWAGIPGGMSALSHPWNGPSRVKRLVKPLVSGSTRKQIEAEGRTRILRAAALPAPYAAALQDRGVNAEGEDLALLWALGSTWKPTPVIQSYSAYTEHLDQRNADRYADAVRGPNAVLLHSEPGDGHHPRFQSPAAIVSMLCHFDPLPAEAGKFQVLLRVDDRCGQPTDSRMVAGRLGTPLTWKPTSADDASVVVGRVDIRRSWTEKLTALLRVRPRTWSFSLGAADGNARYRFDPDTANQPHLLGVPSCLRAKLPRFDTRTYDSLTVLESDSAPKALVTLTITRIPYRCP